MWISTADLYIAPWVSQLICTPSSLRSLVSLGGLHTGYSIWTILKTTSIVHARTTLATESGTSSRDRNARSTTMTSKQPSPRITGEERPRTSSRKRRSDIDDLKYIGVALLPIHHSLFDLLLLIDWSKTGIKCHTTSIFIHYLREDRHSGLQIHNVILKFVLHFWLLLFVDSYWKTFYLAKYFINFILWQFIEQFRLIGQLLIEEIILSVLRQRID